MTRETENGRSGLQGVNPASSAGLETPVLLIIFNRPDTTRLVFDAVRQARPKRLFVKADGPRRDRPLDVELCRDARAIVRNVDWPCEMKIDFEEENGGCRNTVCSGMKWFFENVEEGIILEDDCLPTQSFFRFCAELLAKYRNDERVMQISGNNLLLGSKKHAESYYFSKLASVSGWATWRRSWAAFDIKMAGFPEFAAKQGMQHYFGHRRVAKWMMSYMKDTYENPRGIWSPAWAYAIARQDGLVIVPSVNLVDHLGYGRDDSTYSSGHTWGLYDSVHREELDELIHPVTVMRDCEADALRFAVIERTDPRLILSERFKKLWRWKIVEPVLCFAGRLAYIRRKIFGA